MIPWLLLNRRLAMDICGVLVLAGLVWWFSYARYTAGYEAAKAEQAIVDSKGWQDAATRIQDAAKGLQKQQDDITAALASGASTLQAGAASIRHAQETLHNDPQFDCRKLPLPESYLGGLRRPAPQ